MADALLAVLCMIVIPLVAVVVLSVLKIASKADEIQGDD